MTIGNKMVLAVPVGLMPKLVAKIGRVLPAGFFVDYGSAQIAFLEKRITSMATIRKGLPSFLKNGESLVGSVAKPPEPLNHNSQPQNEAQDDLPEDQDPRIGQLRIARYLHQNEQYRKMRNNGKS